MTMTAVTDPRATTTPALGLCLIALLLVLLVVTAVALGRPAREPAGHRQPRGQTGSASATAQRVEHPLGGSASAPTGPASSIAAPPQRAAAAADPLAADRAGTRVQR